MAVRTLVWGLGIAFILSSCAADMSYLEIPIPDRRMNLRGLEAVSTHYLNEHPQDFFKFSRILSSADEVLQAHQTLTHGHVIAWIRHTLKREGYDERMPVYVFLRTVYLKDWGVRT